MHGEIGALLRREGLYHSNINTWLRQRDEGVLHGLTPRKRGRKPKQVNPLSKEVARLERKNKKISKKLQQAETIIDVQKKYQRSWEYLKTATEKRADACYCFFERNGW